MGTSFFKVSNFDPVQNSHHLATCFHILPGLDFYQNYSPPTGYRGVPLRSFSPSRHFLVFSTRFSTAHVSRWQWRNRRPSNTNELSKFSEELSKFIEGWPDTLKRCQNLKFWFVDRIAIGGHRCVELIEEFTFDYSHCDRIHKYWWASTSLQTSVRKGLWCDHITDENNRLWLVRADTGT